MDLLPYRGRWLYHRTAADLLSHRGRWLYHSIVVDLLSHRGRGHSYGPATIEVEAIGVSLYCSEARLRRRPLTTTRKRNDTNQAYESIAEHAVARKAWTTPPRTTFQAKDPGFLTTSKQSLEARVININTWPKELLGIRYHGGISTHDHSGSKHRPPSEPTRHI